MSREQSDQIALTADKPDPLVHFTFTVPRGPFVPHRVTGLAARLLARSNCIEDRPTHFRDGAFAEMGTTRHAVKP